jgi:hypothetical protein
MSYAGKIEELIAERDELRATLTAVSDSLDYLHGMTPQQAVDTRKAADNYRWLLTRAECQTIVDKTAGQEVGSHFLLRVPFTGEPPPNRLQTAAALDAAIGAARARLLGAA